MKLRAGQRSAVWSVELLITETDDDTQAKASLEIDGATVTGWGRSRRNPVDPRVPRIGEELAAARALADLSHRIFDVATVEIEQFTSGEVHLHQ
jgi:hypothetical protein